MSKKEFQEILDKTIQIQAELQIIQNQMEEIESSYLEKTWNEGNILIGWSDNIPHTSPIKIKLSPKDKIFSLSSVTSKVNLNLEENVDKQINGPIEVRFLNVKKRYRKNKTKTVPALLRRKRRKNNNF